MPNRRLSWPAVAAFHLLIMGCQSAGDGRNAETPDYLKGSHLAGEHVLNCIKSDGHHVHAQKLACPLGGDEFTALSLGTHSTWGVTLDWETYSYMRFPVPIPVCPSNGYVVFEQESPEARVAQISEIITSGDYQELFAEKHASYYLLAKLLEALNENSEDSWWYYRQASSEADVCGSSERYRLYAEECIRAGERRLESLDPSKDEYWTLAIVIPNFYRRIGEFQKARQWLETNVTGKPDATENAEQYLLGIRLLKRAIADKSIARIPLKKPTD